MKKKIIIRAVAVAGILVIAAGVAYYARTALLPATQNHLPKNPAVFGTLVSATPASITVAVQGASQKTFTVATSTQVVSQVKSGEVGKSLTDITAGAQVMVQPADVDQSVAAWVSIMPVPVVTQHSAGPPATVTGTLLSTTTNSITIKTDTEPSLHIMLTKDTVILSNVLAGQKGRSLNDAILGVSVQVFGAAGTNGFVASSIQLLAPLQP